MSLDPGSPGSLQLSEEKGFSVSAGGKIVECGHLTEKSVRPENVYKSSLLKTQIESKQPKHINGHKLCMYHASIMSYGFKPSLQHRESVGIPHDMIGGTVFTIISL